MILVEFHHRILWDGKLITCCLNYLVHIADLSMLRRNCPQGYHYWGFSKISYSESRLLQTTPILMPAPGYLVNKLKSPVVQYFKQAERLKKENNKLYEISE